MMPRNYAPNGQPISVDQQRIIAQEQRKRLERAMQRVESNPLVQALAVRRPT